jgi:23S rRNA pseudouridine1911/1915/1917 synthase
MSSNVLKQVQIVYEDEWLLVVDKPSSLVVHSDQRTEEETLSDWVQANYPELESVGGEHMLDMGRTERRWGVVNRLDRAVSGCVLIAKDEETFQDLARQFRDREVVKKYVAVVYGQKLSGGVEYKAGETFEINEPIGRHRKDPRKWAILEEARNTKREAKTLCKVLKNFTFENGGSATALELQPVTGRTHQLRLHVNTLGTAIVGDEKYTLETEDFVQNKKVVDEAILPSRILLHAKWLTFHHPKNKQTIEVESKLPAEMSEFV